MPITTAPLDTYASHVNDTFPYNVFLYWWDDELANSNRDIEIPFTHSSSIFSIMYTPWLDESDLILNKIPYHVDRFRYKNNGSELGVDIDADPYVYRIQRVNSGGLFHSGVTKTLGYINPYPNKSITENMSRTKRHWSREGKLHNYPFTYHLLNDGISQPFELYPQYFRNLNEFGEAKINVTSYLNINSDYEYFIEGYNGDKTGVTESLIVNINKELPCASSQYSQWMATNKNQLQAQSLNIVTSALAGGLTSMVLSGGNPLVGLGGAVLSAGGSLLTNNISKTAQERDMRNLPNSLKTGGNSDIISGKTRGGSSLKLLTYRQDDAFMEKFADYFHLFGYKQNKILDLNNIVNSRYFFNYVKSLGVSVKAKDDVNIPKKYLQELNNIFYNGVTLWHMDNYNSEFGEVVMFDYTKDNIEVNKL